MSNRSKILLLCGVGHFYSHFFMLGFPTLTLWMEDSFGLSRSDMLNKGFWMYLLFGVAAVSMGAIGHRVNNRRFLCVMLMGIPAFATGAAYAPNAGMLNLCLAGIGVMAAIYHPVGISLVSRCCPDRGKALGNNGIWGSLGIGIAPLACGLICAALGWRWALFITAVPALLIGIGFLFVSIDETALEEKTGEAAPTRPRSWQPFAVLILAMTVLGYIYRGTVVSIPTALEQGVPWTIGSLKTQGADFQVSAAILTSIVYLFGIVGQAIGGRLADAWDLRKAYFLFHLLSLPCMLAMSLVGSHWLVLAGMLYVCFGIGMQPIENSLVAALTPVRLRTLAYSLKFIVVLGGGAFSIKTVRALIEQGAVQEVYRYQSVLIGIVLILILVMSWLSRGSRLRN